MRHKTTEPTRFYALLSRHWWLAFLLLGASFVSFGITLLNFLQVFQAALSFLRAHGVDAIREGVLWQLAELILIGYVAAGFYVLFKVCEHALVQRATHKRGT